MNWRKRNLCRAPVFLHFDLIAGQTCENEQARKPSHSGNRADQFHYFAATQATQNGEVVR
jgi:hypothetical protein